MDRKTNKLLKNTTIFVVGNIGSKFIQFLLVPLYTYTLSSSEYGITELILTTVNLLMPVFSVSIADGLLRFGLDSHLKKEQVMKCSLLIVLFGSIMSVVCIPIFQISSVISKWILPFLIILNLRIYKDVFAINLKIQDKNRLFAIDGILYTLTLCIANIIFLAWFKLGISGYFLAYIIANVLSIIFLIVVGSPFKNFNNETLDPKLLKSILIFSLPMIVNGISWWIINASDRYMIQWFMSESDVGIYSVASKIPSFITTFTGVFNQAWIISSVIEFDNENEKHFYSETFHNYYAILFFGSACLLAIIKPFMKLYVSQEYYIAWKYTTFLICSSVMSGIGAFTSGIYAATKKNTNVMLTTITGALFNIILNFILIPTIGVMGAAIATYISWTVIAITRILNIRSFFPFYINFDNIVIYSVLTLVQCISMVYCGYLGYIFSFISISVLIFREKKLIYNLCNHLMKVFKR